MQVVLAMTLPLNEKNVERLESITPIVEELYCGLSIVSPPTSLMHLAHTVKAMRVSNRLHIGTEAQENRRYLCVKQALDFENATHIHYCDGDHVLSRIESGYSDWKRILEAMQSVDCLIIGRTQSVMESYPTPLRETEKLSIWLVHISSGNPWIWAQDHEALVGELQNI